MDNKDWMLNPTAIRLARTCIKIVHTELGIKLKLSHPSFIELLYDYCELTDSKELNQSFSSLIQMAQIELKEDPKATEQINNLKHPYPNAGALKESNFQATQNVFQSAGSVDRRSQNKNIDQLVEYRGKKYKRYKEGKEFKGLYRGQPRYT